MTESTLVFNKVLDADKFYKDIDIMVKSHGSTYMDAIIHYCETNGLEIETIASIIKSNSRIKAILQVEGESLHFLPKTARLTF